MGKVIVSVTLAVAIATASSGCKNVDPPEKESATYLIAHKGATPSKSLVVFVHGVMGDSRETWASTGDADGWPGLLFRDPNAPQTDVLSLGYRSRALSEASNVEEIAVRTLRSLQDNGLFKRYEQVAFVVHSMGGLVTKRMLRILQLESPQQFQKIKAVVFLSTPAHGSSDADMASWLSSNPQFRDMRPSDFNTFLQVLDNDWRSLLRQRSPTAPYPKAACAYETISTATLKIVPRSLSEGGCDETSVAFDRDHLSIAKPNTTADEVRG
jgi:pimeloyl-ACP methyl ester carboxylesterase